jgi:hypothetical protein
LRQDAHTDVELADVDYLDLTIRTALGSSYDGVDVGFEYVDSGRWFLAPAQRRQGNEHGATET